jgi:hypothetical protein
MQNYRTKESEVAAAINQKEEPRKYADHGPDCFRYLVVQRFVLGAGYHLEDMYGTDATIEEPTDATDRFMREYQKVREVDAGGIFTMTDGRF